MYKNLKPMLNTSEQIEHLLNKGVKFEIKSKEDAIAYLKNNNYYFKLSSYRKNFPKYESGQAVGKYINLDFEMLVDLSIIDMRLRKTILDIALDLEHFAKIRLLNAVEDYSKDGYSLVEKYINELKTNKEYDVLENELNKNKSSVYCENIVNKYHDDYPLWAFLEIIPFGRFVKFYMFIAKELNDKKMIDEAYLLKNVRELRNACAHNNCILNDLHAKTSAHRTNYSISAELSKIGIPKTTISKRMSNSRIQQIVTLLYLNKKIVSSDGVLSHHSRILHKLKNRINLNIDYYSKNTLIQANFSFLNKIFDNWYTNSI